MLRPSREDPKRTIESLAISRDTQRALYLGRRNRRTYFLNVSGRALQDLEAWVPPIPPGKVLIDGLTASAQVLFYSDGAERAIGDYESGSDVRGAAAAHTAGVVSRG